MNEWFVDALCKLRDSGDDDLRELYDRLLRILKNEDPLTALELRNPNGSRSKAVRDYLIARDYCFAREHEVSDDDPDSLERPKKAIVALKEIAARWNVSESTVKQAIAKYPMVKGANMDVAALHRQISHILLVDDLAK